jgi:hypothetical protein
MICSHLRGINNCHINTHQYLIFVVEIDIKKRKCGAKITLSLKQGTLSKSTSLAQLRSEGSLKWPRQNAIAADLPQ